MTTFQDPPPQSRRSARQSERGEETDATADFAESAPPSEPVPAAEPTPPAPYEQFAPTATSAADDQPLTRSARRAREAAHPGLYSVPSTADGEPLDYMTQGRDEPLSYQAPEPQLPPAPRPDSHFPQAAPAPEPPTEPVATAAPQFRVRDFSPEGRITGRRAAPPPLIEPGSAPSAPPSDLEYRTEAGPTTVNIPAAAAAPVSAPVSFPVASAPAHEEVVLEVPVQHVAEPEEDVRDEAVLDGAALHEAVRDEAVLDEAVLDEAVLDEAVQEQPVSLAPPAVELPGIESAQSEPHATLTRRELRQRLTEDAAVSLDSATQPFEAGVAPPEDPARITGSQPPAPQASLLTGSVPPPPPAPNASLVTGARPPAPRASLITGAQPPAPDASLITGAQPPAPAASLMTGAQPPVPDASLITGAQPPAPDASLITGAQPPAPAASLITGTQPPPPLVASPAPTAPHTLPTTVLPGTVVPGTGVSGTELLSTDLPSAAVPSAAAPSAVAPSDAASTTTGPTSEAPDAAGGTSFEFEARSRMGQLAPPSASQRVGDSPIAHGPSFLEPLPEPELDPDLEHTGGWVPPIGHWSRQADLDDETQPWENTVTREVGGGNVATTTSALVLPEMPRANPFPPALNATGEILLTGSIELPRSLSSVGGDSRHFDDSDVDLMYDDKERELAGTDSSPVSAIRAVSTHTSARGVISSANKPHGNRMLTVLLITAAVMAVGVVGLLIAGLAGQIF